jgi:hypothetical protein
MYAFAWRFTSLSTTTQSYLLVELQKRISAANSSKVLLGSALWIFVTLSLSSCSSASKGFDHRKASNGNGSQPNVEVSQTAKASAERQQAQETTSAGAKLSQQLLPLGVMEITSQDVERRCMVSFIGNGRAVTAGHCFAGIPWEQGKVACPVKLKIDWLVSPEAGGFRLSNESASCSTFERALIAGDDSSEFAVLHLENRGVWPERQISFDRQDDVPSGPFKLVGPVTVEGVLSFIDSVGSSAYDVSDYSFFIGGTYQPGFSGAPVFRDSTGQGTGDFSSPALGIYLGRGFGGGRVLRSKAFEKIIESLP